MLEMVNDRGMGSFFKRKYFLSATTQKPDETSSSDYLEIEVQLLSTKMMMSILKQTRVINNRTCELKNKQGVCIS